MTWHVCVRLLQVEESNCLLTYQRAIGAIDIDIGSVYPDPKSVMSSWW